MPVCRSPSPWNQGPTTAAPVANHKTCPSATESTNKADNHQYVSRLINGKWFISAAVEKPQNSLSVMASAEWMFPKGLAPQTSNRDRPNHEPTDLLIALTGSIMTSYPIY